MQQDAFLFWCCARGSRVRFLRFHKLFGFTIGGGGGEQNSWHLTAQAQEKAAHGHVVHAVQEVHPLTPFLTPLVPEMSVVL
jgi:hypothetical protein